MSITILDKKYDINLTKLNLNYCKLTTFPATIGNFMELTDLYCVGTTISTLSATISNLIKLQRIDLSKNKINIFPVEIGNLINLEHLNLANNQLSTLPAEIAKIINLHSLFLEINKISILPAEILKIKKSLIINESSYEINNLNMEIEILIFSTLTQELKNLPTSLKEIWIKKEINNIKHKIPFNCKILFF